MEHPVQGGPRPQEDAVQLLQWLVFLRVVVSSFILITTLLIQLPAALVYLYVLVGANVLFNLLVAFFVPRMSSLRGVTQILIYWDVAFVTLLVYVSGGVESPFSFMYILSLIYAGLLLSTHGAVGASVVCVMAYGTVMLAQYARLVPSFMYTPSSEVAAPMHPREIFFKVLINGIAFFIAAFLSNLIAEQLRRTGAQLAEKKEDLEALRTLNENIVRSVVIGLLTTDRAGKITFVNPTAERILGRTAGKLAGKKIGDLFPEVAGALAEGSPGSLAPGGASPERMEATWEREESNTLTLGFSVAPLRDHADKTVGWIVSFQDLTRLRHMEQDVKRADRLAAVGKLAAGIAHEVRNPLASISGSIQVLAAELKLDSVNGSLMEIVLREADRLNRLISDFLDFARPATIRPEVVDLNLLLDETVEIVRHAKDEKHEIEFRRDFDSGVFVRADSDQIRQLFLNLLLNSVQAMPAGGQVFLVTRRAGESEVDIEVSDTGAGIPEDVQERIFDPFFTTKESGTGLGLTVAYRIVENHGGRMSLASEPGKGARFVVRIPRDIRPSASESAAAEATA